MKNSLYWSYNLPLQVFPEHEKEGDESSEIKDYSVLNYMPRKERCTTMKLSELLQDSEQTPEEYFEAAAAHFEHLASLFRKIAKKEIEHIYYPDDEMNKNKLP